MNVSMHSTSLHNSSFSFILIHLCNFIMYTFHAMLFNKLYWAGQGPVVYISRDRSGMSTVFFVPTPDHNKKIGLDSVWMLQASKT
ncbi:hypothetical protein ACJX0J_017364, partial [Zea mays]